MTVNLISFSLNSTTFLAKLSIFDIRRFTPLSIIYLEAIESIPEEACIWFVTYRGGGGEGFADPGLGRWIVPEWPFEILLISTELVRALLDSEATVVIKYIGVSTRAILSIHDHMGPYIISDSFINSKRIKGSWFFICDVCSAWFELMRGLMADTEASIVIGNILIFVVTALSETLFVFITLIEEHGLIMTRTVHLFDV